MTLMSAASANSSGSRRIISLMIPMELSMRGATGFVARALCISVPKSPGVQSSLTAPACLDLHRPDPIMIVVTPSFVVELAYVKLPSRRSSS